MPISDEDGLRILDWIEGNRRKVVEISGGKVAYVYMPNTGGSGYTDFNRFFYSQLDKQALVQDELKAHPAPEIPVLPYPNYHKGDELGKP